MAGAMLAAAATEFRRAGVMYLVRANGAIEEITLQEFGALTAAELRGCTMCVFRSSAEAESAIRRRVRS
jgi:hypothetical protein